MGRNSTDYDDDLFDWVKKHRHKSDPETSPAAAEDAQRNAGPQMRLVFSFLLARPRTHDELRRQTGLGDNAAKRCSDLKNLGWVKDSGKRGLSDKGKRAVIWEPTDFGREAYEREI